KPTPCDDCLAWTPTELTFNSNNFQEQQILTITRVKDGPKITLMPIFNGGSYDLVPSNIYSSFIE
ncbi:unnamed protein product, partial [Rotaria sp. Silwood1]